MTKKKVLWCLLLLTMLCREPSIAQLKSDIQYAGIKFNGTKSFDEMKAFDKAHPELQDKKYTEAETEEDEHENIYELNKRVSGIKKDPATQSLGIPRINNLKKSGTPQQFALNYCVQFEALPTNFDSWPPDVHGAVGFDHLVTMLNTQVRIQSKKSSIISTVTLNSFWSTTGQTDVFDPRIMYDQLTNRWIAMACVARRSASSGFVLAGSKTPDPTGDWNFYTVDADPADTLWFDYGSMGFCNDKICIAGNMFNIDDKKDGDGGRLFTINKNNVLNGFAMGPITRTRGVAFTTCPALTFSDISTCYALAVWNDSLALLRQYKITGSASSATITDDGLVDYGSGNGWAGWLGNILPQNGTNIKINSGDDRMQSVVYRNGRIYWANNFYWPLNNPSYCGVQYSSYVASTKATLHFAGLWNDTGDEMFCFPSIAVNAYEDVGLAFSYFSKTGYASAAVAYGASDLYLSYNIVKNGEDKYTLGFPNDATKRYRWGDYMSVSVDPSDDIGMWSISQYAKTSIAQNNWGTWWAKLCPVSCTSTLTLTGSILSGTLKKFEATNTITSSTNINSGASVKFDAGTGVTMLPGFRATAGSNYRAFIEGCGGYE